MSHLQRHLAIAGAWGYIGRKFLDAARVLEWRVSVFDPAPQPSDVRLQDVVCLKDEETFLALEADLFHLALHPEARERALHRLLARDGVAILNEKPMAAPQRPQDCSRLLQQLGQSHASPPPILLFDFPEVFDPVTTRILHFLDGFDQVRVDEIGIQRSKDREARDNPRNTKRMVHIQYQETVHCFAFVLRLLGHLHGCPEAILDQGIQVHAWADHYDPPNPADYETMVDGKTTYDIRLGSTRMHGWTDFKAGAPSTKRRVIRGQGDGSSWEIEVEFLEGAKRLVIDGVDQQVNPAGSSYEGVLRTYADWLDETPEQLMTSTRFPNAPFAHLTYQLSSLLWRSSFEGRELIVSTTQDLLAFDAGFDDAQPSFGRYGAGEMT